MRISCSERGDWCEVKNDEEDPIMEDAPHVANPQWSNGGYVDAPTASIDPRVGGYSIGCDYIIPMDVARRIGIKYLEKLAASARGDHTAPDESSPNDD